MRASILHLGDFRMFRACLAAMAAATLVLATAGAGLAQSPAPQPSAPPASGPPSPPAQQPAPAAPQADAPAEAPALPPPTSQAGDPFGEEVQFTAKTVVRMKGAANWDTAYDTLVDNFKSISGYIDRAGLKRAGPAVTVYTSTDDTGFQYEAGIPIEAPPAEPPKGDIEIGKTPSGKMLKFVHRGSYDAMDTTYEAITNYLDSKQLEADENFIEEYVTDPTTTPEDKMVVNVYVPVK
jgi:effector-binding domain-containing protein